MTDPRPTVIPPVACVVCQRPLKFPRIHVDTCGDRCFRALLRRQREEILTVERHEEEPDHG